MVHNLDITQTVTIAGAYLLLLSSSGFLVRYILARVGEEPIDRKIDKKTRDTGFVIGKCENILILTFMIFQQATAIALIFAAKAIVRREDITKNSLFFLAGTMINVTYSVIIGAVVKVLLAHY
jgi:hypothetical protein